MRFFIWLMLRLKRHRRLSGAEVRGLLRLMRLHAQNEPMPQTLPSWAMRSWPLVVWAAWRVAQQNPALFFLGLVSMTPAIPIFFFTVGRWVWRAVRPLSGMGA